MSNGEHLLKRLTVVILDMRIKYPGAENSVALRRDSRDSVKHDLVVAKRNECSGGKERMRHQCLVFVSHIVEV